MNTRASCECRWLTVITTSVIVTFTTVDNGDGNRSSYIIAVNARINAYSVKNALEFLLLIIPPRFTPPTRDLSV